MSMTVVEMCRTDVAESNAEHKYREGYRTGWQEATAAFEATMRKTRRDLLAVHDLIWDFGDGPLLDWQASDCAERITPPTFPLPCKKGKAA